MVVAEASVKRHWWSLGAAWDMKEDIINFGYSVFRQGDYVQDRFLLNKRCLFLFHPDALEYVLQKRYKVYTKDVSMLTAMKVILGEGLTTSEGELWLKQRRLVQPFFHREKISGFAPVMIEMTRAYLEMIHPSSVVEMQDEMDRLSLSISLKTLFQNTSFDEVGFTRDFGGIGEDLTSYIRFPFPPIAVPIPRNRRLQQKIALVDRHIWRIIEERRLHPQPEADILQTLIECNEPRQVRDEMLTLVLAGYQTTAQTLSFAWSLLAQHPTAMQKLYDEIEQVLHGRNLSVDDLSKFVYARHILMETLRLYPPSFGLIRESVQEDEIFGHKVAAHTVVCMAPYYTHRHPLFWEDPESFDPDRFLPERGGIKHRYAYVPFGGGPHQCLGNHFAIQEALIILIMVAQRYHVRFADPSFQPEVRALAMMKMRELPMVFEER